jgi:hypothetical protein
MSYKFLLILFPVLVSGNIAYPQENDCKVLKPAISDSYTGDCRNGLADGKGVARGIDYYEGQFDKGLPSGKGTYKWADGTYYEGHWENGNREGAGKMVYRDSTVTGYWKDDIYAGKKLVPPYEVMRTMSVSRYNIIKSVGAADEVRIRILQGGADNRSVSNLSITSSSGDEFRTDRVYGLEKVKFPLDVKVRYTSRTMFGTSQFTVNFDFRINEPGVWDVTITN